MDPGARVDNYEDDTDTQMCTQTHRHTDTQTHRHTDTQNHDTQTHRHTEP